MKQKKQLFALCLSLVFVVLVSRTQAQDSLAYNAESLFFQTVRINQTESYITFGQGLGNMEPLVFEALAAPYFLLRTNKNARWGATLSPMIMIRMSSERSFPIRTPSYMPQVNFFYQFRMKKEQTVSYLFMKLAHHSNGQDGNFYNLDGTLNTRSGDFSTNFYEVGLFSNRKISQTRFIGRYYQSSFEIHPDIDRSKELEGEYSFFRWHNVFSIFHFSAREKSTNRTENPKFQTTIETTWLFGDTQASEPFDLSERLNLSFTFNYRPEQLKDVAFFANLYSGEDYYNMHFSERLLVFRIGLQAHSFK